MKTRVIVAAVLAAAASLPSAAWAQLVLQDDFTGASETMDWKPFNGACLTAGDGSKKIPACAGLAYYNNEPLVGGNTGALPDAAGYGALRFTNGRPYGYNQNGAIVSNFTFNTTGGLNVTFKTVTYRGDSGGGGGDGADGISFYLMDSAQAPGIGAFGGSLGYTCSNSNPPYDGLVGGYLGLGIDEYGNFLNPGDNTATGPGYQWNRIGLRGAGSISWAALNAKYPAYYPASLNAVQRQTAVQTTCSNGKIYDFSGFPYTGSNVAQPAGGLLDYPAIANGYQAINSIQIANEAAVKRSDGTPITYNLKITPSGGTALLSLSYSLNNGASYQAVLTNQDISSNGAIPANFRFGFAGSTGGSTNIHEILCFKATPANQSQSSAGLNQQQTSKVQTGSQVYFAFYNPLTWAGSLTSQNLGLDASGNVVISQVANWDAACVLTGVAAGQTCAATGGGAVAAQAPANRNIFTWSGSAGIAFEWNNGGTTNLTGAEKSSLDVGDATPINGNRLAYLRGDRSNEINAMGAGLYRARVSVLGDIINSSPAWVGPPQGPYGATWTDKINTLASLPENSGPTYTAFKGSWATRTNVVYTGANDGMLHGFRTGAYSGGVYNAASVNDGRELLAYVPGTVINGLNNIRGNNIPGNGVAGVDPTLDFSDSHYGHNFYIDSPPATGDLYYNSAWHTWLVGGLGAGGAAIYALEITDPTQFTETNAANVVKGEWTSSAGSSPISCVNGGGGCGANMGKTYGIPQIRRFHNGNWGAVIGNGLGSASGDAGVYVMLVNPTNGAVTFYYLSAGKSGTTDGVSYATAADLDGDHIVDYIYAGDLLGNVWRFDVTSATPATWASTAPTLLFKTASGQPITSQMIVASTPAAQGPARVMVDFGTGQQKPFTNIALASYSTGTQNLYGIWDWNMAAWNAKNSTQFASLAAGATGLGGNPIAPGNLQAQSFTDQSDASGGFRSVSNSQVCWQGDTVACASGSSNKFGWSIPLPGSSGGSPAYAEQVIFNPTLASGVFIVNTTIAASNTATSCTVSAASGWTIAISPTTGGSLPSSFFADPSGAALVKNNNVVSALALSGTGSVSIVSVDNGASTLPDPQYLVTQTVAGGGVAQRVNPPAGTKGGRLTWRELR